MATNTESSTVLPQRIGSRPRTGPEIPHQQLDQIAPGEVQTELWRRMTTLEGVRAGRSGISLPDTRALHLEPQLALGPGQAYMVGTEFAHLHGAADGSLHVMLPAALASEAIDKGWAELHPMARRGMAPPTLVMLYGPRDQAELETIWELVVASHAFARGQGR
jgi:hypothetical protein